MLDLKAIAVAIDGSAPARRALEAAIDLAKLASASLTVVGVVPIGVVYTDQAGAVVQVLVENRRYFEDLLSRSAETARNGGVRSVSTAMREGGVVEQLLAYLDEQRPDLMVLGARGLSMTRRILLGSVSDGVVHHSSTSILIIRPPEPPRAEGSHASIPANPQPSR
jgi:nucleotide-binding universal stress UspA family protein